MIFLQNGERNAKKTTNKQKKIELRRLPEIYWTQKKSKEKTYV